MTILRYAMCLAIGLAAATAAQAQQYKWIDANGHVQYGDIPPPGVKAKMLRPPPGPAQQPAVSKEGKGPMTPAEREREYQRRAKAQREADAKADQAKQNAEAAKLNCENAQQALRNLESGQRISRVGANGERYFLSDAQRAQETTQARAMTAQWCK